ncbi:uncharacterized protein F54H12.2-like [Hydractinia symbiolongicarpus]|uniref:uncharacterized protein F54H12.2-like n=1 Tax=Hydractinia symbiolongicarpus TaxID=13093 RepID=UPI002550A826|nr:uncharacterized protein F54H12.2-like [Hydractinia symbiolongicarpus]
MAKTNSSHLECTLSDTDVFTPAFVQSDIEHGCFEDIFPITNLDDNGPVEFSIDNATNKFLHLVSSTLNVKCRVTKADGTNLTATDGAVALINYPISSLFSQVDVSIGGSIISSSTNTYSYRAFIETLLNYGEEAKKSQLTMGLFAKDTSGHMDASDAAAGDNAGLVKRQGYTARSRIVELSGRLHCDIFNQGRLLLNGLSLKITLHRNKDAFCLMTNGDNPDVKVKFVDVSLRLRKLQLTPKKFEMIQTSLERTPACYPINRVQIKTHSLAAGLTSLNWDNAILGKLPNRLFIAFADNDAHTGSYVKNPFNFKHFNVTSIGVYVNGESLPANPMKLNFPGGHYLQGYRSLFTATGKINRDEGLDINREEYSDGYSLFGFDLSPSLCNGEHYEPQRQGSIRIALEFGTALPNTITVFMYADFENTIHVNKARNILKDF